MNLRIALCQMSSALEREESYERARVQLAEAAAKGADVAVLPEIWTVKYSPERCLEAAEEVGGPAYRLMADAAKEYGIYLVGGSIPIRSGEKIYNSCFVFDREGREMGRYDKCHLFDIDIEGGVSTKESAFTIPGDHRLLLETEFGTLGIAICYDLRFASFFERLAQDGAEIIILPAAFSMQTGEAHWEILCRARALDSQCYLAALCNAADRKADFVTYGHSMVVDPWGRILGSLGEGDGVLIQDIETEEVASIRRQLQTLRHQRPELYG